MSVGIGPGDGPQWTARDRSAVRRAAWRAAAQATALVAAAFVVCGALTLWIVVREEVRTTQDQLVTALRTVDDVTDPPDGIFLLLRSAEGRIRVTGGAPSVLPDQLDLAAVGTGGGAPVTRDLRDSHGVVFRVRTARVGRTGVVAQAALSLAVQRDERSRLVGALAISGLVALVAAAGLGAVSGRRAVSGLVDTTSRQRRFVADAGHELRTPLTVLTTRTQLLERHLRTARLDPGDREQLSRDIDALLADSGRLAELLDDLLLSAEPVAEQSVAVDLRELVREAAFATEPVATDRGVEVLVTGDDGAGGPILLLGGPMGLRRCVAALLDNATRHTPAGGCVTVAVDMTATAGSISVTDTGPGISPQLRPRLFDRFAHGADEQVDESAVPAASVDAGTPAGLEPTGGPAGRGQRRYGLGLALVADIVHRLGGDVDVASSASGTTFTISVPRGRR